MNCLDVKAIAAACIAIALNSAPAAKADMTPTYLSLGDSIGFGETVFQNNPLLGAYSDPSYGDRGFVGMFANYLGSQAGGVRPNVINLAIAGETTSSFTSGAGRVPPGPGFSDLALAQLNLNYAAAIPPTQSQLLSSTIAAQAAAGSAITNVTISLGANDLFTLALSDPNPVADLPAALNAFQKNYETLLGQLRSSLPGANVYLIGPYNPFTAAPTSPFAPLAAYAIPQLNDRISLVAQEFNAHYVDTFNTPLTSDAADYTLITAFPGDVHPNFDKGYGVIAGQLELASVPEPTSISLVALGIGGLATRALSRRRSKAA